MLSRFIHEKTPPKQEKFGSVWLLLLLYRSEKCSGDALNLAAADYNLSCSLAVTSISIFAPFGKAAT